MKKLGIFREENRIGRRNTSDSFKRSYQRRDDASH